MPARAEEVDSAEHKMKNSSGSMLDLSFLTEEEYEKLMKVLQRDADLQKKDYDRIR